jgi:tetratricopeptide (TPR) repeat protein
MRSVHRLFCAALLVFLAIPLSAQNNARLARVNGTVVDSEGKSVRGATVTLESTDGKIATTTTDERGRFSVPGLPAGRWHYTIAAPGFETISGEGALRAGGSNPPMNAVLRASAMVLGSLSGLQVRDIQADLATADALFDQQRWEEAIAFYRSILSKAPVLTHIHLQVGAAYRRKGDPAGAMEAYKELLKAEPGNDRATVGLALATAESGNRKSAEEILVKAAGEEGSHREVLFALGELSFEDGSLDNAMTWYRKAADADSSWGKPLYKLGLSAAKKGESAAARDFLVRVMAVDPMSPEAALAKAAVDQMAR